MSVTHHHIPDSMLAAYAAGTLPQAFAVVVATHVSMCSLCRASLGAHEAVGGAVLDMQDQIAVSDGLKSSVLDLLDAPYEAPPAPARNGIYPGPVAEVMKTRAPRWKTLGMGVRQDILFGQKDGSLRLLYIPPGQAVPDHGHNGLELTLVLQGSFSDETGQFGVGDVEVADETLEHTPVADPGDPCICLAATDAPLRFRALAPRLLQPLFRI